MRERVLVSRRELSRLEASPSVLVAVLVAVAAAVLLDGVHAVHAGRGRGVGVLHALHRRVHQRPVAVHLLRVGHAEAGGVEAAVDVAHAQRLAARGARAEAEELQEALAEPAIEPWMT